MPRQQHFLAAIFGQAHILHPVVLQREIRRHIAYINSFHDDPSILLWIIFIRYIIILPHAGKFLLFFLFQPEKFSQSSH